MILCNLSEAGVWDLTCIHACMFIQDLSTFCRYAQFEMEFDVVT